MKVELLYHAPLWVASKAIRKCWASEDKSDTGYYCDTCGETTTKVYLPTLTGLCPTCGDVFVSKARGEAGPKDKELIYRVGNKNKHSSTLEHLNYTFDIDGISRACLQELARHRHTSLSVKSTRYTLKELKTARREDYEDFLVPAEDVYAQACNIEQLEAVANLLNQGVSNDRVKYLLPEAYKTSLVWTINARSLQNFLSLRTDKSALWEIRDLAKTIFENLPEEHKYLFEEFVKETD